MKSTILSKLMDAEQFETVTKGWSQDEKESLAEWQRQRAVQRAEAPAR